MNVIELTQSNQAGPTSAEREKTNSNRSDDALDGGKAIYEDLETLREEENDDENSEDEGKGTNQVGVLNKNNSVDHISEDDFEMS